MVQLQTSDGKEPEPTKNEPYLQQPNPNSKLNNVQEPKPYPVKNQTEPELKCRGSYSVLSLNEIVGTFTNFTVNMNNQ